VDATTRLRPWNGRGRTGVDSIEPRANLGRPRRFSVGVYFAFEALNQLASECGSLFVRESKRFYQELLGVHKGTLWLIHGGCNMDCDPRDDYGSRDGERFGPNGQRRGGSDDDRDRDDWEQRESAARDGKDDTRDLARGRHSYLPHRIRKSSANGC